jgi:hypothetical protein
METIAVIQECRDIAPKLPDEHCGGTMPKTLMIALMLTGAMPAFASDVAADTKTTVKNAGKDVGDTGKDASDSAQDTLHTDSGLHKVGRHANRTVRHVKRSARDLK